MTSLYSEYKKENKGNILPYKTWLEKSVSNPIILKMYNKKNVSILVQVGIKLNEILENLNLVTKHVFSNGKRKVGKLTVSNEIKNILKKQQGNRLYHAPSKLPMIFPPKAYSE